MLSPFIINDKNLFLDRYPVAQVNRSLQAWDSADEYLVNYVQDEGLISEGADVNIVVINDSFGAITASILGLYNNVEVFTVNDSFLSSQGILHNIQQNCLSTHNLTQLTSLDSLPDNIDLILYKIPKSKSLLIDQLLQIKQHSCAQTLTFIAGDRAKEIHSSTLKYFEKHLGTTTTSLAVKKSRLVFCQLDNKAQHSSPFPTVWDLEPVHPSTATFTISNLSNVYARDKIDLGARYFLQNLPYIPEGFKVIDLGCGNGVLGLHLLAAQPEAEILFIDESYMAIESAKTNIKHNLPASFDQCRFKVNDCLTDTDQSSVDLVLCNPPFHQQTATTDHIAWQMFNDSFRALKKGGELRIIGNRQLAYHIKLQRIFGNCKEIATNNKFVTLSAKKR
jgi:23S rRNA (guanine1835-N2)-methyltransferase